MQMQAYRDFSLEREEIAKRMRELSDEELMELLAAKLALTAKSFLEAAMAMLELEKNRNRNMSGVARNLAPILRKIAYGQMLPDLIVYCGSNERLLTIAMALPIPDQVRLIESSGFEFAEGDDCRMVDPRTAEPWQMKQLFASDHIRPIHEQRQWLAGRSIARKRRFSPRVTLASEVSQEDMTSTVTVCITPEWESAIRLMAKENCWPVKYAATRFLISLGKR